MEIKIDDGRWNDLLAISFREKTSPDHILSRAIDYYIALLEGNESPWTLREVEAYAKLGKRTIRRAVIAGELKTTGREGHPRFWKKDVEAWISGRKESLSK